MVEAVDSHQYALLAWAKYRQNLNVAPRLITLDHHTDTSSPFRRFIKKNYNTKEFLNVQSQLLESIDFMNLNSVAEAIEKLNNDEHIVTAIKTGVISSAFVLAHNAANTDFEIYKEHKIACRTALDHNLVLESSLLDETVCEFNKILKENSEEALLTEPYILDIDLDYFNTFKSIDPDDSKTFNNLIRNAGLITIATEPIYVKSCALDEGLTSDFLLKTLSEKFLS